MPSVVVHVPSGWSARAPLHVVVLLHSWGSYAMQWLASGETELRAGEPHIIGWGLDSRHDAARTAAILIAPQFDPRSARDWSGRLSDPTFFRQLLDEVLGESLVDRLGPGLSSSSLAEITLVASSAGGFAAETIVARSDLADRVDNVVLFDALYRGSDRFVAWVRASERRRFVSIYGGGDAVQSETRRLVAALSPSLRARAALYPRGSLERAVRASRVVVALTSLEHIGMALALYAKVLRALGLPTIDPSVPHAKLPRGDTSSAERIAVGQTIEAALEPSDTRLSDDSRADDYAIELTEPARLAVEVRATGARGRIDPLILWVDNRSVIAEDDDGLGGTGGRLVADFPAGTHRLRVTTHGPWQSLGRYRVSVAFASER